MNKLVNGTIIEISNINLFEKASEDLVIDRGVKSAIPMSNINLTKEEAEIMSSCIDAYKRFYMSMPYPLYGLDCNTKYCAASIYISKNVEKAPRMFVDNALFIELDKETNTFLEFVNFYWGIVKDVEYKDNTLDISKYNSDVGFKDIVWAIAHMVSGSGTSGYYSEFMPDFIEACNKQVMVLKWELSNILSFHDIPQKLVLPNNKIVSADDNVEYIMDIYVSGRRPTKQKEIKWKLTDKEDVEEETVKYRKVYGYDLYSKIANVDVNKLIPGRDKMKPVDIYGVNSLFCTLCAIKNSKDSKDFDDYKAIIYGKYLIFEINNRLFLARSDKYTEALEIAKGVNIYSIKNNSIYFTKSKVIASGVKKETIYSYSLEKNNLKLCKIQFVRI